MIERVLNPKTKLKQGTTLEPKKLEAQKAYIHAPMAIGGSISGARMYYFAKTSWSRPMVKGACDTAVLQSCVVTVGNQMAGCMPSQTLHSLPIQDT